MKTTTGFIQLCCVLTFAAGAPAVAQNSTPNQGPSGDKPSSRQIEVTGCLTSSGRGDAFVLTPLKKDALSGEMTKKTTDVAPTYTYELLGGKDLNAHVGQTVSVTGALDKDYEKEADVDRERVAKPPREAGAPQPQVKTEEKAEIEVRRLQVQSVKSLGKPCATS